MPYLSLTLIGTFQAHLDDNPLGGFQSDKARALLAYLVVEADRPHSRSHLAGLFWPDLSEKRARTYLRHALANLRKILGDTEAEQPFLLATHNTLQFNQQSDHRLDIVALLTMRERVPTGSINTIDPVQVARLADRQAALDQYTHPFLQGFFLADCPAFEEWVLLTRERLQRHALNLLHHLADAYEQIGEHHRAQQTVHRCVELEPWREEAHRRLMYLLAQSGQRSAALAQYEQCCRLLDEELNVTPGAETTALYHAILRGDFDDMRVAPRHNALVVAVPPILSSPSHNLPAELTPLLSRDKAILSICALFHEEEARLVTLTGPGGVGKTRLGIAAARAMFAAFADGVYMVELATIREAGLLFSALAEVLNIRASGHDASLAEQVMNRLREQHILLLLDNFEHLVEAAPDITTILVGCPHLKVLVTSRTVLHLRGEFEFVVPPLVVPDATINPSAAVEQLAPLTGAMDLFAQRARAANHGFMLDETNIAYIAQICARLDGLPLAIELAAARIKYFTPQALLARLTTSDKPTNQEQGSLQFLRTERPDVAERQHSLWATIAWSYDLLALEEQRLFRRLAVFVGGWTPAAAAAVCGAELTLNIEDGLTSLVDKHLIGQAQSETGEPRFLMLETIREFGLAQLEQSAELLSIQRKHADLCKVLAIESGPHLRSAKSVAMLKTMHAEYANIRSALRWALTERDVDLCLEFSDALLSFWNTSSYFKEAEIYLLEVVAIAEGTPPSVAYVNMLASAGYVLRGLGKQAEGNHLLKRCLAMDKSIGYQGSPTKIGIAYGLLAWSKFDVGDYNAAEANWEEALTHAHKTGDGWNLAMQLVNMGCMAARLGELDRAESLIEEGLTRHRRIGQQWAIAKALSDLGYVYICQGNLQQAKRVLLESQQLSQAIQSKVRLITIKQNLALIAIAEADYITAAILLQEALIASHEADLENNVVAVLQTWLQLAVHQEQYEGALWLAGVVDSHYNRLEIMLPPIEKRQQEALLAKARQTIGQEAATAAWVKGEAMTLDKVVTAVIEEWPSKAGCDSPDFTFC